LASQRSVPGEKKKKWITSTPTTGRKPGGRQINRPRLSPFVRDKNFLHRLESGTEKEKIGGKFAGEEITKTKNHPTQKKTPPKPQQTPPHQHDAGIGEGLTAKGFTTIAFEEQHRSGRGGGRVTLLPTEEKELHLS